MQAKFIIKIVENVTTVQLGLKSNTFLYVSLVFYLINF